MLCCVDPSAYVDHYADSYSINNSGNYSNDDDSLSFYFIFLTENSVEISGTDNPVSVCLCVCVCVCLCVCLSVCLSVCQTHNMHVCGVY